MEAEGDAGEVEAFAQRLADFKRHETSLLPPHLREADALADPYVTNFLVYHWYATESFYAWLFRLAFAVIYYSVPLFVSSVALWSGAVGTEGAGIIELFLVSLYTGPILSRAISEVQCLRGRLPMSRLLLLQTDVPLVASMYGIGAAAKSGAALHSRAIASASFAGPAIVLYLFLASTGRTAYAFGFHGHLRSVPSALQNLRIKDTPSLLSRFRNAGREVRSTTARALKHPSY